MTRRRFTERDVIRTLIHQGVTLTCFRTGEPITLENVGQIEREHLHEVALDGPDVPANCRYSLKAAHKIATNGTKSTTAGSSKNRIAKANNPNRTQKFAVNKPPVGEAKPRARGRSWPSREIQSRGFDARHRPMRGQRA